MATTLVTGATGFIGSTLIRRLASRGDHIRCLVRKPSKKTRRLESLGVELFLGDLDAKQVLAAAVEGCDTVFHVAGLRCALTVSQLFNVNENGTRNLAEACGRSRNPPKLILVSSVAAAGPTDEAHRRREDEPPIPVSNYGKSKLAGEMALREFAAQIPSVIVRPGIVFGPENLEVFPVFRMIRRFGLHIRAGFRTPPVSMIHVNDLVEMLLRVEERGERLRAVEPCQREERVPELGVGVYNACDEFCPDWKELGDMVAKSVEQERVAHVPLLMPVAAAAAGFYQICQKAVRCPHVFNLDKIREARGPSWAFSNQKLFASLQFQPAAALQQRIDETGKWYLDNGWL